MENQTKQETALPELISVAGLMEYLKCSPTTAYNLVRKKDFPSFKIGGKYYINKDKIPDWISREEKKASRTRW